MIQPRLLTMIYSLLTKEPTATEMSFAMVYARIARQLSNVINKHYASSQACQIIVNIEVEMILGLYIGTIRGLDFEKTML